ncbi:hypothetical protein [Bifidobacterium sp. UBA744]|uniref:hypothetical protein n=1 Tax=Bifidobacterium sp. UBA744 TaxID=1946112 RepID=UPI0025BEFE31|nr:hypothetical protein [Bifidobacterium sp. UBA744]
MSTQSVVSLSLGDVFSSRARLRAVFGGSTDMRRSAVLKKSSARVVILSDSSRMALLGSRLYLDALPASLRSIQAAFVFTESSTRRLSGVEHAYVFEGMFVAPAESISDQTCLTRQPVAEFTLAS